MSLSSINGLSTAASASLSSLLGPRETRSVADPSSSAGGVPPAAGASRFASALSNAFASLGISFDSSSGGASSSSGTSAATSASTDAASSLDPGSGSDVFASFVQSLFAALHAQTTSDQPPTTAAATSTDATASTTTAGPRPHGHHHHGGGHRLGNDLDSLVQQLTGSSPDTSDATTSTTTASSTSSDPTLTTLEDRFGAVLAQSGSTSSTDTRASLATFLQALAGGLHGAPSTGNVVSTAA